MANDILFDSSGDLAVAKGDFVVGNSDEQNVHHILIGSKGDYKQHPTVCVGIEDYLKAPTSLVERKKLEKEILNQLKGDNATDIIAEYGSDGKLKVAAVYG